MKEQNLSCQSVSQSVSSVSQSVSSIISQSTIFCHSSLRLTPIASILFALFSSSPSFANGLQGMDVISGKAHMEVNGATTTIKNSPNAILNWQSFNINKGDLVQFIQENKNSAVFNKVVSNQISELHGTLKSNGQVFLINPNGIIFGKDAVIDTSSFVASTLNISNEDLKKGKFAFEQAKDKAMAEIVNNGLITVSKNGTVAFVGGSVTNNGKIKVENGNVFLLAGQKITLSDLSNPAITYSLSAPKNKVLNLGDVFAKNGKITLSGGKVTNKGTLNVHSTDKDKQGKVTISAKEGDVSLGGKISADGVYRGGAIKITGKGITVEENAVIDLKGKQGGGTAYIGGDEQGKGTIQLAEKTEIKKGAKIDASATEKGNGGKVVIWGDKVKVDGKITAKGGEKAGDGGFVETSGKTISLGENLDVDASAKNGKGGEWLLDPYRLNIVSDEEYSQFLATFGDSEYEHPMKGSYINVNRINSMLNQQNVTLSADFSITLNAPIHYENKSNISRRLTFNAEKIWLYGNITDSNYYPKTGLDLYLLGSDNISSDKKISVNNIIVGPKLGSWDDPVKLVNLDYFSPQGEIIPNVTHAIYPTATFSNTTTRNTLSANFYDVSFLDGVKAKNLDLNTVYSRFYGGASVDIANIKADQFYVSGGYIPEGSSGVFSARKLIIEPMNRWDSDILKGLHFLDIPEKGIYLLGKVNLFGPSEIKTDNKIVLSDLSFNGGDLFIQSNTVEVDESNLDRDFFGIYDNSRIVNINGSNNIRLAARYIRDKLKVETNGNIQILGISGLDLSNVELDSKFGKVIISDSGDININDSKFSSEVGLDISSHYGRLIIKDQELKTNGDAILEGKMSTSLENVTLSSSNNVKILSRDRLSVNNSQINALKDISVKSAKDVEFNNTKINSQSESINVISEGKIKDIMNIIKDDKSYMALNGDVCVKDKENNICRGDYLLTILEKNGKHEEINNNAINDQTENVDKLAEGQLDNEEKISFDDKDIELYKEYLDGKRVSHEILKHFKEHDYFTPENVYSDARLKRVNELTSKEDLEKALLEARTVDKIYQNQMDTLEFASYMIMSSDIGIEIVDSISARVLGIKNLSDFVKVAYDLINEKPNKKTVITASSESLMALQSHYEEKLEEIFSKNSKKTPMFNKVYQGFKKLKSLNDSLEYIKKMVVIYNNFLTIKKIEQNRKGVNKVIKDLSVKIVGLEKKGK